MCHFTRKRKEQNMLTPLTRSVLTQLPVRSCDRGEGRVPERTWVRTGTCSSEDRPLGDRV